MRDLNAVCKKKGKITIDDFIMVLQPLLPPDVDAEVLLNRHIFNGEDIQKYCSFF